MYNETGCRFAKSHEWAFAAGGVATVGISDYAQKEISDIVFVELPKAGAKVVQGKTCAVIESVKAASDIYAPVAGEVIANNQDAIDAPESINADSYANWLFKLAPANAADVAALMDAAAYEAEIAKA